MRDGGGGGGRVREGGGGRFKVGGGGNEGFIPPEKLLYPKFKVSKLGGGGKYPFAAILFVFVLTPGCCEGVDKGWLLRL